MKGPRRLPVYLIHWNEPEWVASASRSLLASEGVAVDVCVVDNGQTKGPPLRECLPPGVRVLDMDGNRGYAGGANAALDDWRARDPDGDFCVVGSHDLHVRPDALARLVEVAEANPTFGVVAPVLTGPHAVAGGVWTGRVSIQVPIPDGVELVDRDWASGTCLLLRRSCVDQVGPFDERLGSYVEDVDYGMRARDLGWRVVVVTAAKVRGLGTSDHSPIVHVTANTLLLHAKRSTPRALAGYVGQLTFWIGRGYVASVWPWRTAEERAVSRSYASQRVSGIIELARSRRLREALRERASSGKRACGTSTLATDASVRLRD